MRDEHVCRQATTEELFGQKDTELTEYYIPSDKTVKLHVKNVLAKLNVRTRNEVADARERAGLAYTVRFAPDKQPDPPEGFDSRFDSRLSRFYGFANMATEDVLALPRK